MSEAPMPEEEFAVLLRRHLAGALKLLDQRYPPASPPKVATDSLPR